MYVPLVTNFTNRMSHTGFPFVPKLVTSNHFALFHRIR